MGRHRLPGLAAVGMMGICFALPAALAKEDTAALAKALPAATVTLQQGLAASEREGKPISGKYEIEDGALQLSVYTAQGSKFTEVIVDHSSGVIKKAEPITDAEDVKDATEQNEAMGAARVSLNNATMQATAANPGYSAVKVVPTTKGGHPVAGITLMKGEAVKTVEQKLD
jgi:hypothetical protein